MGSHNALSNGYVADDLGWPLTSQTTPNLAHSAILLTGLYILPVFFLYLFNFFNGRLSNTCFSEANGPIFTKSSGLVEWQPIKVEKSAFFQDQSTLSQILVLNSGITKTESHQISTRCTEMIAGNHFCTPVEIWWDSVLVIPEFKTRICDKVECSGKNANFSPLIGCHGNVPGKIEKAQWDEQALTAVYQSWNFGEDLSIRFWATGSRKSTIKLIRIN